MANYIKSEFYRAAHTKWLYGAAAALGALTILFNLVLWLLATFTSGFRYGTTSFSYSNLVAQPMVYCFVSFILTAILYEGQGKNGTRKNAIAYGISRTNIFLGNCLASLAASFLTLIPVLAAHIASGSLLLEHCGPVGVQDLLLELPAASLVGVSSVVLAVFALDAFGRTTTAILVWYLTLFGVPHALFLLSIKLPFLYQAALWMPANFFNNEYSPYMAVNLTQCSAIWDTPAGMAKCLGAGAIGIALFGAAGVLLLRNRDA